MEEIIFFESPKKFKSFFIFIMIIGYLALFGTIVSMILSHFINGLKISIGANLIISISFILFLCIFSTVLVFSKMLNTSTTMYKDKLVIKVKKETKEIKLNDIAKCSVSQNKYKTFIVKLIMKDKSVVELITRQPAELSNAINKIIDPEFEEN